MLPTNPFPSEEEHRTDEAACDEDAQAEEEAWLDGDVATNLRDMGARVCVLRPPGAFETTLSVQLPATLNRLEIAEAVLLFGELPNGVTSFTASPYAVANDDGTITLTATLD